MPPTLTTAFIPPPLPRHHEIAKASLTVRVQIMLLSLRRFNKTIELNPIT